MTYSLMEGLAYTLKEEGISHVAPKVLEVTKRKLRSFPTSPKKPNNSLYDVIFINGCDYSVPHPIRYRVDHQIEQLAAAGFSASKIDAWDLSLDILRHGRLFIIFRCPITDMVKDFIAEAKALNKRVLFDIDDLVIDTKYTDQIPFVAAMKPSDKAAYDDGVVRMRETLLLCDGVITTTEGMATELSKYNSNVYINRNTASEAMRDYSEIAAYRRDVLTQFDSSEVPLRDLKIYKNALTRKRDKETSREVRIGYFSGSITHNDDFELILPCIVEVMSTFKNVTLLIMGDLDIPEELSPFATRITAIPFSDWRRLPSIIASCDINLAPLRDTVFNCAKSENKWIEASLVKVPTVASNVGAFKATISNGKTGFLCDTRAEWTRCLSSLIESPDTRKSVAEAAYQYCIDRCTTIGSAKNLADIIRKETTSNLAMVLPSLKTSGGVLVALRHCAILQDRGLDVTLFSTDDTFKWFSAFGHKFPVLNRVVAAGTMDECPFYAQIDKAVATLWDTVDFLKRYPRLGERFYLVQNFETDFILPGNYLRLIANSTYFDNSLKFLTISKWCVDWLQNRFGQEVNFARNGIDVEQFYPVTRDFSSDKIRILIEGDCSSEYKNVDESFMITNRLNSDKYEIWYMTYTGTKKSFYRIDRNLGAVPHDDVADIYRQCHILLKTSKLESFSYPPLEMMATGGFVVARPNGGNAEYLIDNENCLLYSPGDYEGAVDAIERISSDVDLRLRLIEGSRKTVMSRDWKALEPEIAALYE